MKIMTHKRKPFCFSGIFFCFFLILSIWTINKSFSQSYKKDVIRIVGSMTDKNLPLPLHLQMYLSGNYLFEEITTLKVVRHAKLDENKNIIPDPDYTTTYHDSLTKYILTDLNLKQCVEYNLSDTLNVINTYPLTNKKAGYRFKNEMNSLFENEIQNFYFVKDTTMNGYKYVLLEDTIKVKMNSINIKKIKVYLTRELPGFPFHFINATMDIKYNGICTRCELYDSQNNLLTMDWHIDKEVPIKKCEWLYRFIDKYKTLNEKNK